LRAAQKVAAITIFEKSPAVDGRFYVMFLVSSSRFGIASKQVEREPAATTRRLGGC
jgi:hypothetical protein